MGTSSLRSPRRWPLWTAFWLWGVLVSHALFGLILASFEYVGTRTFALMLLGFLAYTAWILRAIWKSAGNVRNALFGQIALSLTIAWAINALLVCGFLLLGHVGVTPAAAL